MKFCSQCGEAVRLKVPDGDNRERFVCDACETIHYQNPRIVTGCLPVWEDRVLLCKRAIQPRRGYWTLPAGFLENGEACEVGAARETLEEANAQVQVGELYTLFSLPHISQIYMFYRASLTDGRFSAGEESLEVELFHEHEVPWDDLAFPVIKITLEHYFADRLKNAFPMRSRELDFTRRG
jgi:ADP-ribose pyrophosphatase YjhB (NUDIX family)